MKLSSNTLFHFTREKDFLVSILRNGIFIRYSLETYGKILKSKSELVLPMSCFCDIPLSQISEHRKKYGSYSIGLSKEWGLKNGLSPVLYTHAKSETAKVLNTLSANLENIFDIENSEENQKLLKEYGYKDEEIDLVNSGQYLASKQVREKNEELSKQLGHFLKYVKPYSGTGYSNGNEFRQVKFYDEREWRYVPPKELLQKIEIKDIYKREFYTDEVKRRYINMRLAKHKKLTFKPKDIKFIVVEKEDEIPPMIEKLREIFGQNSSYNDLMILNSRIISLEQIIEDL
ncbi:abortive infection system antitoxin AbiGi family protein [Pseudofulvibacter geojedonensis]|uniref:Abortive infection system antitoxin AbiGi family protein n=1 Tax=Pseudofulvibacter geojedonensis TaxID=1123758 RepID=A0ABW3I090_9FLAO